MNLSHISFRYLFQEGEAEVIKWHSDDYLIFNLDYKVPNSVFHAVILIYHNFFLLRLVKG